MAALIKGVIQVLSLFFNKEDLIKFALFLLILPLILVSLVFIVPTVIFSHVPAVDDDIGNYYIQAAKSINNDKNIQIQYLDVIALDAVLLNQEFENSDYERALKLTRNFIGEKQEEVIEEYEEICTKPDPKNPKKKIQYPCSKTRTKIITVYFTKTLDDVLKDFISRGEITQDEAEQVLRYATISFDESEDLTDITGEVPPITNGMFMKPSVGVFSSGFGKRWGKLHAGVDIAQKGSIPVVASADGTVSRSNVSNSYGNVVFIVHNINGQKYETVYAHMKNRAVKEGDTVTKGQFIGYMGNTGQSYGQHLHFEIHLNNWNNQKSNALNPLLFIQ
jgi:murein DD-endopeptidase MepM/ murein hydrolase activator NlpD